MIGFLAENDDFYVNLSLNTQLELPSARDTVLHYFEQMRKAYPELTNFFTRENGDLVAPAHLAVAPLSAGEAGRPGGYSLARSQTVSNLPLWAEDLTSTESLPQATAHPSYAYHAEQRADSATPHAEIGGTAATLSTRGSLRSKIGKRGASKYILSAH